MFTLYLDVLLALKLHQTPRFKTGLILLFQKIYHGIKRASGASHTTFGCGALKECITKELRL